MSRVVKPDTAPENPADSPNPVKERVISTALWVLAGLMAVAVVVLLVLFIPGIKATARTAQPTLEPTAVATRAVVSDPGQARASYFPRKSVVRSTIPHTELPDAGRSTAEDYVVEQGDSLFAIAKKFDIQPDTVFWANYDALGGSPDMLSPGLDLVIPPGDGIYYKWKQGDTIQAVADKFYADPRDILLAPINKLDLTDPQIEPGTYVMVPGGKRETVNYFQGSIPRGSAGTLAKLFGEGGCDTSGGGLFGTGAFINPMNNGTLIGNDYIDGVHQGIDLGSADYNNTVMAADSGLVVYSGWANGGYGYTVMIDHGGGYQSLYAHLSELYVSCGQSVTIGQPVALMGSTGNSTGPHLHFEIRYMGMNDNPWNHIY